MSTNPLNITNTDVRHHMRPKCFQVNMSKHLEDGLFFKLVHTINNHITYVVIIEEPPPPGDVYKCNKSNIFVYVALVSDRSVDFILIKTDICVWARDFFPEIFSLIYIFWGISLVQVNSWNLSEIHLNYNT